MKTWRHTTVDAPALRASEALPDEFRSGRITGFVLSERSAEGAFWGRDARRYALSWHIGRTHAKGYVEVRPLSTDSSELVVHLQSPQGLLGWLAWPASRLTKEADAMGRVLRREIESRTAAVPARTARLRTA